MKSFPAPFILVKCSTVKIVAAAVIVVMSSVTSGRCQMMFRCLVIRREKIGPWGCDDDPWSHTTPRPDFFTAEDRKSTRLNSSHVAILYAVFCLKKKRKLTVRREGGGFGSVVL